MGSKRGKYMSYNTVSHNARESHQSTLHNLKMIGKNTYDRVAAERCRHYIGEKMVINKKVDKETSAGETVEGRVIGIYPHFLLLHCGNYKTTVSYIDILLGGRVYESRRSNSVGDLDIARCMEYYNLG